MRDFERMVNALKGEDIIFSPYHYITEDGKGGYGDNVAYNDYGSRQGIKIIYTGSGKEKPIHLKNAIKEYLQDEFASNPEHKIDKDTVDRFMGYLCGSGTHIPANKLRERLEGKFEDFVKYEEQEIEKIKLEEQKKESALRTRKKTAVGVGTLLTGAVAASMMAGGGHDSPDVFAPLDAQDSSIQRLSANSKTKVLYPKELGALSDEQLKNPDEIKKVCGCSSYTISYFPSNHTEIVTKKIDLNNPEDVIIGARIIAENEKLKNQQDTKSR